MARTGRNVSYLEVGEWLGERFHHAGGVPAVMWEVLRACRLAGSVRTISGQSLAEAFEGKEATDQDVIKPYTSPLKESAGFLVLNGNLFETSIIMTMDRFIPPDGRKRL